MISATNKLETQHVVVGLGMSQGRFDVSGCPSEITLVCAAVYKVAGCSSIALFLPAPEGGVDSLDQWRCFCILWGGGELVELLGQHHGVDVESGLYNEVRVGESVGMYPSKNVGVCNPD
jgi:hypothetical protein